MPDTLSGFVWESSTPGAKVARAALAPLGAAYAVAVAVRNAAYDSGWLPSHGLALPAIGVGNLTVGGTGKTPIAAWIASRLASLGARPAVVLRGYGDDETLVHERLNPGIPVVADADRVRGVARARELGATIAVLDDGFQHRRARRDVDVVLISADRFTSVRPLPAGPWREPLSSLARAHAVVVTRKNVPLERAHEVLAVALRFAQHARGAVALLAPGELVNAVSGESRQLSTIDGADVLAISAIGDAHAFESQLRAAGARVSTAAWPDHHRFMSRDAAGLAARMSGETWAVCTLKDAVKLGPLWPRNALPLWYLSQRVSVETGGEGLDGLLAALAARTTPKGITTPAPADPTIDPNVP
jgi:tetraacyldisaccharide 4'-kinase